jgi:uncharacterized protein YbjT (DUF2867 family)
MQPLTAVVLGATGLIGEQLVQQLLNDPAFSKVRILVRRPVQLSHPKLEVRLTDFGNLVEYRKHLGQGDCIFCCIGTTNKNVKGDKNLYRRIDYDIPVNAGSIGKDAGFTKYLLVSSVGANATSANFYLSLKGEVERALSAMHFQSFHAFRPSMLYGKRKKFRPGEIAGRAIMKPLSFYLFGGLKKYKGIDGAIVAQAMVAMAKSRDEGGFVHHYSDVMNAIK